MKKYISPVAIENDILAEAIYAASGDVPGSSDGGNGSGGDGSGDYYGGDSGDSSGGSSSGDGGSSSGGASQPVDYVHDPNCWSITPDITQKVTTAEDYSGGNYANVRVQCNHPTGVQHVSSEQQVVLVFSQPVESAKFDSGETSVSGCTVTGVRTLLGDAYSSGDNFNAGFTVRFAKDVDISNLSIVEQYIYCTHETNVQGGFD